MLFINCGLMVIAVGRNRRGPIPCPGGLNVHRKNIFDIVNICYKLMMRKTQSLSLLFQQCGVLAMLSLKPGSGQMADCYSHVFSLIHPVDEFSFNEKRTWGQSEISTYCICNWCKVRKIGGRESPRLPAPMVESFFTNIFLAIKSNRIESPFELCILLGEQDTISWRLMQLLLECGEEINFSCVCVAETVLLSLLLSILLGTLLLWRCVKIAK